MWGGGKPAPIVRGPAVVLTVAAALSSGPLAVAAGPDAPRTVVAVYPDDSEGAPGAVLIDRALRSTFASQSAQPIVIRNEYVDTSRLQDPDFMEVQVSLLKRKYAGRKVDLVIASLSAALDFVLRYRDEVFRGVPVVYAAVDRREVEARRLPPDVIGVTIRMDLIGTLDLALRFHPDTRRVFVIAGSSQYDTEWEAEARQMFRPYENRLEFVYLTGLPMVELLGRVADLPEQSIIYYLHIKQDGTGMPFFPAEALDRLALKANAPLYGHVDTYVGRGIVGGHVYSFEAEGRSAARLGLRLLAGEKPESIPVPEASESTYLFDWRQMRRWGIGEESLPPGSVVRNKELTVWDVYKWHIIGVTSLCLLQAVLIAGLLIQRAKRQRAVSALQESETRFKQMADAAPVLIWAAGPDKGRTYFNRLWLEFTGRTLELEMGDGWAEGIHPDDAPRCLEVYATNFDARLPFELSYRLRRHDGEYRWLLGKAAPRYTPDGVFVGGAVAIDSSPGAGTRIYVQVPVSGTGPSAGLAVVAAVTGA